MRLATGNPTWGHRRIQGELARLGHTIAKTTVWQVLTDNGIDPAPMRSNVTWTEFLQSQAAVACDFFTVDTAFLLRYYVGFFIKGADPRGTLRRRTDNPTGDWTTQPLGICSSATPNTSKVPRALLRDRASQFTDAFDEVFRTEGFKILRTPVQTPVSNTFAERWIRSIRHELLDRTIIWNQKQLERLVVDYIAHNEHRPHQSLEQRPPIPVVNPPNSSPPLTTVRQTRRYDGLINEYRNAA